MELQALEQTLFDFDGMFGRIEANDQEELQTAINRVIPRKTVAEIDPVQVKRKYSKRKPKAKLHWSQTPKGRKIMAANARKKRGKRSKVKAKSPIKTMIKIGALAKAKKRKPMSLQGRRNISEGLKRSRAAKIAASDIRLPHHAHDIEGVDAEVETLGSDR